MGNRRLFLRRAGLVASSGLLINPVTMLASPGNTAITGNASVNRQQHQYVDVLASIIALIDKNDSNGLNELLGQNPALRTIKDEHDRSLIWIAALKGKSQLFPALLTGYTPDMFDYVVMGDSKSYNELVKADPYVLNGKNKSGYTPLLAACECGNGPAVQGLVGSGARMDFTLTQAANHTALTLALTCKDANNMEQMLQAMLGNGADPNKPTRDGYYPLHLAIAAGNVYCAKMLLRKNADTTVKDKDGKTPLDYTQSSSNGQAIRKLIQSSNEFTKDLYVTRYLSGDKNIRGTDDTYGLPYVLINEFVGAAHFNVEKTKASLARIPDLLLVRATWDELAVEACNHTGVEPLVKFLLDKGAPFSICTAAMLGETATVKGLLQKDKRIINDRGPHDFPLIWYAAIGKPKLDMGEVLLNAGIDINANIMGRSVLGVCASNGCIELTEFFCSKGADVNMRSYWSFTPGTPLEIARKKNNDKVAEILVKYGAK
jgi:uncharacterized protein